MRLTKVKGLNPKGEEWTPVFEELISDVQAVEKKEDATGTVYGLLKDNYRSNKNIIQRDGIILDIDKSPTDVWEDLIYALKGHRAWIHTTWSHNPEENIYCYRAIVETTEPIQAEDYDSVAMHFVTNNDTLMDFIEMGILDTTCKDKARFYYDFSCSLDRRKYAKHRLLDGMPYKPILPFSFEEIKQSSHGVSKEFPVLKQSSLTNKSGLPSDAELIGEGKRNHFLGEEIGRLIHKHKNKVEVIRQAIIVNHTRFHPPIQDSDVCRQVDNLWDKHLRENPDFEPIKIESHSTKRRTYTIHNISTLPPVKWLMEGVFIDRGIATIYGDSGSSKSFLAIDLAMHLALGRDWFGHHVIKPIPVLYTALEGFSGLRKRCQGWVEDYGIEPKTFYIDPDDLLLGEKSSVEGFIEHYKEFGFSGGLIIVDTFNMACPNINENDSSLMGGIMKKSKQICDELDCSILIIHHAGKDESRGMRGSSALKASMDTVIHVKQDAHGGCSWTIEKLKDGKDGIGYNYRLREVKISINNKEETTCLIDTLGQIEDKGKKAKLSSNQEACFRLIKDYLFKLIPDPVEKMELVIEHCANQWTEHPQAKRTHDMRNAISKLILKGLLNRGTYTDGRTEMVWLTEKGKKQ